MPDNVIWDTLIASTEPVNPLYARGLSLGPYGPGNVLPAGSAPAPVSALGISPGGSTTLNFAITDAPAPCGNGADGQPAAPTQVPASGWWTATLCPVFHASNLVFNVKPSHTFTIETTALGSDGLATTAKAMPLIALYAASDNWWDAPSLGVTPAAFNGLAAATTAVSASSGTATVQRIGIADQRGGGRPDFFYQGRIFYADAVEPIRFPAAGGTMTITGMGFRQGNSVLVNGTPATVSAWSATSITATVPTAAQANVTSSSPVDVRVFDRGTGASSTISRTITYDPSPVLPNAMILTGSPSGNVLAGDLAAAPFAVRVVAADGVTPVANVNVALSASPAQVRFAACNGSSCMLATDAQGNVSSTITPLSPGTITLMATAGTLQQTAVFTAQDKAASMLVISQPPATVNVGESQQQAFVVRLLDATGTSLQFRPVTFTVALGSAIFNPCFASTCTATTDQGGYAYITITATKPGPIVLQASGAGLTRQVTLTAVAQADTLVLEAAPNPNVYVNDYTSALSIRLLRADGTTGDYSQAVTFSAPAGVTFTLCGSNVCQLTTNSSGRVGTTVQASITGTFVLRVSFGSAFLTTSITVSARTQSMRIVSSPSGTLTTGVTAATPFTVEVADFDGVTPVPGSTIAIAGPADAVLLNACGKGACLFVAGADGTVSSTVTPLKAGTFSLSATCLGLTASASFNVVSPSDTLQVVTAPPSSVFPADPVELQLRLLQPDGSTPDARKTVTVTFTGPYAPADCTPGNCQAVTDAAGLVSFRGAASSAGAVSLTAAYGTVTQTVSFTASARPNLLHLVSQPASSAFTGDVNPSPFTVQELLADGVTPVAGAPVLFAVTAGNARVSACAQPSCSVITDANGRASTPVTALSAGLVSLVASAGALSIPVTFTAVDHPETLQLLTAPTGTVYVAAAATPFAVRVLAYDGSPVAGRSISFSASSGSARFGACPAASCTVVTDAQGTASTGVTPQAAGTIVLLASFGALTQTASFTAVTPPDTLQLASTPASPAYMGDTAQPAFAVKVLAYDGTPLAGRNVTFTVPSGSARLDVCGAAACTVNTGTDGIASTSVTPFATGNVTLLATYGSLTQTATLNAVAHTQSMQIVSAPASPGFVGDVAQPAFELKLIRDDGLPLANIPVTFSLRQGNARLGACAASPCTVTTDTNGLAATTLTPLTPGTLTVEASYGALNQAATLNAVAHPQTLSLVSVPASPAFVGDAAQPAFAVRVLAYDGTPVSGAPIVFTLPAGTAHLNACSAAPCTVTTDANGIAATTITPLATGALTLLATYGSLTQTATLNAVAHPQTLALVSVPASPAFVGDVAQPSFAVKVLAYDGTPVSGAPIVFTLTAGTGHLNACSAAPCTVTTDANGIAATTLTPLAAGALTLLATYGSLTQTATLNAFAHSQSMQIFSVPASPAFVGDVAQPAFAVKLLRDDGVPLPNLPVTFSIGQGNARLSACPVAPCTVYTDASGLAATTATPLTAGTLTVLASYGPLTRTATLNAVAHAETLSLVSSPPSPAFVGDAAQPAFAVKVLAYDGTPVAGASIVFTVPAGNARLNACSAVPCTITTDATGIAATTLTPLAAGPITLLATYGELTQSASLTAVKHPDALTLISAPSDASFTHDVAAQPFSVRVLAYDGTPVAGSSVTLAVTQGSALLNACAANSCTVVTDSAGLASSTVTPLTAGTIMLLASYGSLTRSATFTAVDQPDKFDIVSAPVGPAFVGDLAQPAFMVSVTSFDGTPLAGRTVTFLSSGANAAFGACPASPCNVMTDGEGHASVAVTPLSAGTVSLSASYAGSQVQASFSAQDKPAPDKPLRLLLVSTPADGAWVGDQAAQPFAVRLVKDDGVTPVPGQAISFAGTSAGFGVPPTSSLALLTDANGQAQSPVTPTQSGVVTLHASSGALVATSSFTAVNHPDLLTVLSQPSDGAFAGDPAPTAFAVRLTGPDGKTPRANQPTTFTLLGGSAILSACSGTPCIVATDNNGLAATSITPSTAGVITVQAASGSLDQTITFMAIDKPTQPEKPNLLAILSAPGDNSWTAEPAATAFTIRLMKADGVHPVAGAEVILNSAQATFTACAASPCVLQTDAEGEVSSLVVPTQAGAVSLNANSGTLVQTTHFNAVDHPLPDSLVLVSAPSGSPYVGSPVATPFAVRVLDGHGAPAAGRTIVFAVSAGSATLSPCCTLLTGADGLASVTITPTAAGPLVTTATGAGTTLQASLTPQDKPPVLALTAGSPTFYVAENAVAGTTFSATLTADGKPSANQTLAWVAQPGLEIASAQSRTDGGGTATMYTSAGPFAAGAQATLQACANAGTCVTFTAFSIPLTDLRVSLANGAAQDVNGVLLPVKIDVTEGLQHPVAGAPVTLYQTVTAYPAPCPATGRCPAQPILSSLWTQAVTDSNGQLTLIPATLDTQPTQTNITITSGPNGVAHTVLVRHP